MPSQPTDQVDPGVERSWLWRHRGVVQALLDGLSMAVGILIATVLRYEFAVPNHARPGMWLMLPIAAGMFLVVATLMGLYAGRWSYGSVEEVVALGKAVGISSVILVVADATVLDHLVPVGACIGAGPVALAGHGRVPLRVAAR